MKRFLLRAADKLPVSLKRQITRAGMAFGREEAFPSIYGSLTYLRKWGFRPRYVVDVGAYHGEWTLMMKEIFPESSVLMIEAQESKRARLETVCAQTPGVQVETALLGAAEGEAVTFVEMETGSSVFEEISEHHLDTRQKVEKQLATLDTLVTDATGWDKVDFLKLDVQGYELEILRGASDHLPRTEVVLMEVSIVPRNQGCPTIEGVFEFMTAQGFRMLDFCSQHRRPNKALGQTDLLFLNARSAHAPRIFNDHAAWLASRGLAPAVGSLSPTWKY